MSNRVKRFVRPEIFLIAVNLLCAAVGLVQTLVVAASLGAPAYAVIGILVAIASLIANFWDVRLFDLAMRLLVQAPPDGQEPAIYRKSVAQLTLAFSAAIVLLAAATSMLVATFSVHLFVDQPVALRWIVAQAMLTATASLLGTVFALQRLTERFYAFGAARIVHQILGSGVVLGSIWLFPNLDGYFAGAIIAAFGNLVGALVVLDRLWASRHGVRLISRASGLALPAYRQNWRFILGGTVIGYGKMIHRWSDVLMIGYFTSDQVTGVYRLARTVADGLQIMTDALSQYYFPVLVRLRAERRLSEFWRAARRLAVIAAAVTVPSVAGALVIVPPLAAYYLPAFDGIATALAILILPFLVICGVHLWLWPLLVERGEIGHFAALSILAALVQAGVTAALLAWIWPSAAAGSLGYVSYYVVIYPAVLIMLMRRRTSPGVATAR